MSSNSELGDNQFANIFSACNVQAYETVPAKNGSILNFTNGKLSAINVQCNKPIVRKETRVDNNIHTPFFPMTSTRGFLSDKLRRENWGQQQDCSPTKSYKLRMETPSNKKTMHEQTSFNFISSPPSTMGIQENLGKNPLFNSGNGEKSVKGFDSTSFDILSHNSFLKENNCVRCRLTTLSDFQQQHNTNNNDHPNGINNTNNVHHHNSNNNNNYQRNSNNNNNHHNMIQRSSIPNPKASAWPTPKSSLHQENEQQQHQNIQFHTSFDENDNGKPVSDVLFGQKIQCVSQLKDVHTLKPELCKSEMLHYDETPLPLHTEVQPNNNNNNASNNSQCSSYNNSSFSSNASNGSRFENIFPEKPTTNNYKKKNRNEKKENINNTVEFGSDGPIFNDDFLINFGDDILKFTEWVALTKEEKDARQHLVTLLKWIVFQLWPNAVVQTFGSFECGLSLPCSDVDFAIMGLGVSREIAPYYLEILATHLQKYCIPTQLIPSAKVPVLKFCNATGNVHGDVCFEVPTAMRSVEFVRSYLKQYPIAKDLIIVLKSLLRQNDLNTTTIGGISSYAITLLVVSYFRIHEEIARSRSTFSNDYFEVSSKKISSLLVQFLWFYATHDLKCAFSPGATLPTCEHLINNVSKPRLEVRDPLDETNDVTKGCTLFLSIKQLFLHWLKTLAAYNRKQCGPSILATILQPDRLDFLGRFECNTIVKAENSNICKPVPLNLLCLSHLSSNGNKVFDSVVLKDNTIHNDENVLNPANSTLALSDTDDSLSEQ